MCGTQNKANNKSQETNMKREKNTNKKFYQQWTREQLVKELCRLNKLLKDCLKTIKI